MNVHSDYEDLPRSVRPGDGIVSGTPKTQPTLVLIRPDKEPGHFVRTMCAWISAERLLKHVSIGLPYYPTHNIAL